MNHAGCSLLEVSRWLGHKSIRITADTYGHLVPESWERARKAMEAAMRPQLTAIKGGSPERARRDGTGRLTSH
ncbi:hypothetical protein LUZ64_13590 [Streptomyces albireticuli]|nr:hypothetical protein [Streptomyces albireticuli]